MSDRRFELHELIGSDGPGGEAELAGALSAARAVEAAIAGPDPKPAADLADRVMAAVAREPAPHRLGILAALRRRPGLGGFVDSLRVAWDRVARGAGRPLALRAGALAYVAAVLVLAVSLSGVAAYTTAGALGLLGPQASRGPDATITGPSEAPVTSLPTGEPSAGPSETPEPSESAEPSETPEASEDDGGSGPGEPGDDHASATATPGEDGGGDGSSEESATPSPTRTPGPSPTPEGSSGSSD
jgi:hypothetical protein